MSTTYTTGPWLARIDCIGIDVIAGNDSAFGICDIGSRKDLKEANYPLEVAKANAKLIAAAPDLLAALQHVKADPWYEELSDGTCEVVEQAINKVMS